MIYDDFRHHPIVSDQRISGYYAENLLYFSYPLVSVECPGEKRTEENGQRHREFHAVIPVPGCGLQLELMRLTYHFRHNGDIG